MNTQICFIITLNIPIFTFGRRSLFVSSDYVLLSDHCKVLRLTLYQRSFNRNINPTLGSSFLLFSVSVLFLFSKARCKQLVIFLVNCSFLIRHFVFNLHRSWTKTIHLSLGEWIQEMALYLNAKKKKKKRSGFNHRYRTHGYCDMVPNKNRAVYLSLLFRGKLFWVFLRKTFFAFK